MHAPDESFVRVGQAEKYQSKNPVARLLVQRFMRTILYQVNHAGASEVFEVGCGEGHILGMLAQAGFSVRGCDISAASLEIARQQLMAQQLQVQIFHRSVYDLSESADAAETVLCCEGLEHLEDPEAALDRLLAITKRQLILSVPREPIWCILNAMRGKYWSRFGNTPGHIQHWSRDQFVAFVSRKARVIDVSTSLPWTIIRCRPD